MTATLLCLLAGLALEPFGPTPSLERLDRTLKKAPPFRTQNPGYALLAFGEPIAAKVWLVQDGDELHLDLNGNGDLSDPGERFAAKAGPATDPSDGQFHFEIPELTIAGRSHRGFGLSLRKVSDRGEDPLLSAALKANPNFRYCSLWLDCADARWPDKGLGGRIRMIAHGSDPRGCLQLGKSPAEAPILHFGGPLQLAPDRHQELVAGREHELSFAVMTPGVGAGSSVFVGYENLIPEGAHPQVKLQFAAAEGKEPLPEVEAALAQRC